MDEDSDPQSPAANDSQNISVSQVGLSVTQDKTLADIFGADSDSDDDVGKTNAAQRGKTVFYGEYDSLSDSDDDGGAKKSKTLKLTKKSSGKSHARDSDDDDLFGRNKSKKLDKKKKRKHEEKGGSEKDKAKRSKREKSSKSKDRSKGADTGDVSSGDEYDSGADMVRDQADDAFLASDSDDDLRAVTREYDADNQVFDDERPDPANKKKKPMKKASNQSHSSGGGGGGGSSTKSTKDLDPMSQTLESIKKPKSTEMTETDKARIVSELLRKMDLACRLDDELFRQKQPAIHKLQLLKAVESIVEIKALQSTLLEYDILGAFKDWLEPKDDKTLPSLEVRTSIYKMLLQLPCQVDHLKRASAGKQPIGVTIVALRKHKMETEQNKRLLKEIMEKWSRPVFAKSVDARGNHSAASNVELLEIAAQRHYNEMAKANAASSPRTTPRASSDGGDHGDVLSGAAGGAGGATTTQGFNRLRASCPVSKGFLFTVQPKYKEPVHKPGANEAIEVNPRSKEGGGGVKSEYGETRDKLLKIMRDNKTVKGGKKQNIKAVGVTLNGRNKA